MHNVRTRTKANKNPCCTAQRNPCCPYSNHATDLPIVLTWCAQPFPCSANRNGTRRQSSSKAPLGARSAHSPNRRTPFKRRAASIAHRLRREIAESRTKWALKRRLRATRSRHYGNGRPYQSDNACLRRDRRSPSCYRIRGVQRCATATM